MEIPEFFIDMNKKGSEKWLPVEEYFKSSFDEIKKEIMKMYSLLNSIDFVIKKLVSVKYDQLYYLDDLEYFAKVLNLDLHIILAINLFYELTSACTTICTNINGNNMMFRTMDWDLEFLKKITFKIKTKKYEAITWFGCVGLFTASNNSYAIAMNYRRTKNINFLSIMTNAFKTLKLDFPASYLIREIFDKDLDLETAYGSLKKCKLISPVYFTFCPIKKSPKIIVRTCDTYETIKYNEEDGYICQTNIDYDNKGDNILWSIERKQKVEEIMKNIKFNSETELLEKINAHPIINHETIYASVLIPGNKIISYIPKNKYIYI